MIDFSSQIFPLYAVKKGDRRTNLQYMIPLSMANTMVKLPAQYVNSFVSYNRFSKLAPVIYFPMLTVQIDFLLLLLCRAVTPKVIGI